MTPIAGALLAGLIGVATVLLDADRAQAQQQTVKNIVLVHGAFVDGSSWSKVIPILEARGFHVVAVQNPLTSLADDVNATRRIISLQDGPVILVGHSWGGAVITEAGDDLKVAGLVYVAAYVPDAGTSANDTSGPYGFDSRAEVYSGRCTALRADVTRRDFQPLCPGASDAGASRRSSGTRTDVRSDVRRKVDSRGVEVEAILACDLDERPDVDSCDGRSRREEGWRKGNSIADLSRCHVARAREGG